MNARLLLLFGLTLLAAPAAGDPPLGGLEISLRSDRQHYFLGENVIVHFHVANQGTAEISLDTGGDYRGSPRHLRFLVDAVDDEGREAPDPHPNPPCFGGLSGPTRLKPGQSADFSLALLHYRRLEHPGRYRIHVRHDLGLKLAEPPGGRMELHFDRPTPAQAEGVVRHQLTLPTQASVSQGQPTPAYQDFSVLRDPVYVDPLLRLALPNPPQPGPQLAIDGLANIAALEATDALLRLSECEALRLASAGALAMRLPDPQWQGVLDPRGPFDFSREGERRYLCQHGWDESRAPAVARLARQMLLASSLAELQMGGYLLSCVGQGQDLPLLAKALDQAMFAPLERDVFPRPRGATMELMRAVQTLLKRGATASGQPRTSGERLVAIMAGQRDPALLEAALRDPAPPVREQALRALPRVESATLGRMLRDSDTEVQRTACELAATNPPQDWTPLVEIVGQTRDEWVLRAAVAACRQGQQHQTVAQRLAQRLNEPEDPAHPGGCAWREHFTQLLSLVMKRVPGNSMRTDLTPAQLDRLRRAWLGFLQGPVEWESLSPGEVPRELLPEGFEFN